MGGFSKMGFKFSHLFKGVRRVLRGFDDIALQPLKGYISQIFAGKAIDSIKGDVQERVLAFLANNYEDEAFEKMLAFAEKVFEKIEIALAPLPDFIEDPIREKVREAVLVTTKFLERASNRIEDMASDDKITDSELDEVLKMFTVDFLEELEKNVFGDVVAYFKSEDAEKEDDIPEPKQSEMEKLLKSLRLKHGKIQTAKKKVVKKAKKPIKKSKKEQE